MFDGTLPISRRTALWAATGWLAGAPVQAARVEAQELLARSDALRNPSRPFALTTTLLEYRDGHQKDEQSLRAYSSVAKAGGQFRTLVRFEAPQQDVGKLMLKDGSNLWFFDPASKATIRVSPQQRLIGQAANGDVVTTNFAVDYSATLEEEESITDGDHRPTRCQRLALQPKNLDATYHHARIWLDHTSSRPVKAQFFVESGKLLKTAYYRRLQTVLGEERPTETVLIDGLDPNWITVMRFDQYAWRDVPEVWLQRDYLARFIPE